MADATEKGEPGAAEAEQSVSVTLVQLSGDVLATLCVSPNEDVSSLVAAAREALGAPCKLLHGEGFLAAGQSLATAGLTSGAEVTAIVETLGVRFDVEQNGVELSEDGTVATVAATNLSWVSVVSEAMEGPNRLSLRLGGTSTCNLTDYFVGMVLDEAYQGVKATGVVIFSDPGVGLCLSTVSSYSGEVFDGMRRQEQRGSPFGDRKFAPGDVVSVDVGCEEAGGGLRFGHNGEWSAPIAGFAGITEAGPYRLGGSMYNGGGVTNRSLTIVHEP